MALHDTYDSVTGTLDPGEYSLDSIGIFVPERKHLDLRSFFNVGDIVPWTMLQMELWNYEHFSSYTMQELEDGEELAGTDEAWTNADSVGPNSTYRYANTIVKDIDVGTPETVTSTFVDDISTNFNSGAYIEMVLRDFPAQAAAAHFDLANSFVDFTSSPTYSGGQTDSIPLNASLTSLTAGGNLTWRIPRTALVNSTLTNLTGIRFRLTAAGAGTATFKASAMRLIPFTGYSFDEIDIDTKRQILTRSVPAAGGTEPSTTFGHLYMHETRPVNVVFWVKFHNGHNPVGNDNKIVLDFRYSQGDQDAHRVTLTSRSTQSRLAIDFWDGASATNIVTTPINTNILTEDAWYYLRVELQEDKIQADIYNAVGALLGSQKYGTGQQTMINDIRNGYVGYSFEPYYYDFYLDYIGSSYGEFGSFESTIFESNSWVRGATLWEYSSQNFQLFNTGTYDVLGDVITSDNTGGTITVTRSGNEWFGGVETTTLENIGDSRYARITGEILATGNPRGNYRIALRNNAGQVVWMAKISPVVKNQWRTFTFYISRTLLPDKYSLQIHQTGFFPDTFRVRNLNLDVDTVSWWGSNNGGTDYYPFLNSINQEYSALHFNDPGYQLRIKAYLTDARGWIQGYKLKPRYKVGGQELSA